MGPLAGVVSAGNGPLWPIFFQSVDIKFGILELET